MLIESIGYTAMLVDYIARATHRDLAAITQAIGADGISRLAHNAPMNRHLPLQRIACEVMADYGIVCKDPDFSVMPDDTLRNIVITQVQTATQQKNMYASMLYDLLRNTEIPLCS